MVILLIFILIQFYPRPGKNTGSKLNPYDISLSNKPPLAVQDILKQSCYDCHSNNTVYPWYASIQPVAWWLGGHISQGKKDLNFSEFGNYTLRRQYKKLEQIIDLVKKDEMPLPSYTIIHTNAKLDEVKKRLLLDWVGTEYSNMQVKYPPDSLAKKK